MNDLQDMIILAFLMLIIGFLSGFGLASTRTGDDLEKQAIHHGVATYSEDGKFMWKDNRMKFRFVTNTTAEVLP